MIYDEKSGYNSAITYLTTNLETDDEDILLLLSDDFKCPYGWDEYLYKKFADFDGALFLNDGYQDVNVKEGCLCITLACMTFSALKKLNKIVFNPAYNHFFSDTEAYVNLRQLDILKDDRDIDNMVFYHNHYCRGGRKQDEYDLKNHRHWGTDHETFDKRMQLTLDERLRI